MLILTDLEHLNRIFSYGWGFKVRTFKTIEKCTAAAHEMDTN